MHLLGRHDDGHAQHRLVSVCRTEGLMLWATRHKRLQTGVGDACCCWASEVPSTCHRDAEPCEQDKGIFDRTSIMSACSYTSFMHRDMKWATLGWKARRSGCHGPEKGNSAGLYTRGGSKVGEVLFTQAVGHAPPIWQPVPLACHRHRLEFLAGNCVR